jgi:hypothetical protein
MTARTRLAALAALCLATPALADHHANLWHGTRGAEGPARFGAPAELANVVIPVEINHVVIFVDPWRRYDDTGFEDIREAQIRWRRAQGFTGAVRTHVNRHYEREERASADPNAEPSATIRIRERFSPPPRNIAQAPSRVIRVIRPDDLASAE